MISKSLGRASNGRFRELLLGTLLAAGLILTGPFAAGAQSREESSPPPAEAEKTEKSEAAPSEPAVPAEPSEQAEPQEAKKTQTFPVRSGSVTYTRTEESEKKKTADGEIETHRVRMPSYGGDQRVLLERETRTKRLGDGTVEREHVLKNPDGANRLVPIEIIREKIKTDGDVTTIEREVVKQDYAGRWQATRKERVTESGPDTNRQITREAREPGITGEWKLVDREVTTATASDTGKESKSVRQVPDASGRLADYEVRQERTTRAGDKESTEVSVQRRDLQDTHQPKMILVERTKTEQTKAADGRVSRKTTTESDLVAGGASRNITPGAPKVVEERTEEEAPGTDGTVRRTVTVRERGAVNREMRPSGQILQETDAKGNVRQIYIPAR